MQLRESDPWIYQAPRQNDFFLTDVVLRANLTQEHKEIFNRVRLNLKVLTASDIVCVDKKTKIHPSIIKGRNKRGSNLHWPKVMDVPTSWI